MRKYANDPSGSLLVALSPEEYSSQKDSVIKLTEIKDYSGETVFILGKAK